MPPGARQPAYALAIPLVVLLILTTAVPCRAEPVRASSEDEAVELLTRAMRSATQTTYRGVQRVQTWAGGRERVQTLRVRNAPGQGTHVSAAKGGDAVTSVTQPDGRTTGPQLDLLTANYSVVRAGVARVAGRLADIVDAKRGASRLMARYWLDRATGLVLRRDVFDDDGRLARRSVFLEVKFGGAPPASQQQASARSVPLGRQIPLREVPALRADGWTAAGKLGDVFTLYDVRTNGHGANASLHLSYSDGISVLSVFEQRGHLDESHLPGWRQARVGGRTVYVRDTVPRQLMWAGSDTVFTVVTDAPDQAVGNTVRALPGAEEGPGFWTRIARGLSRIVSWCNPF